MKTNKAIILAGGKGTRLYPVTLETPKPLLTVHRKAILTWLCEMFIRHEVNDILVIISKADTEEFEWWKKRFDATHADQSNKIEFATEDQPMGTFGMVKSETVRNWLNGQAFFLSNGDELKDVDLSGLDKIDQQNSPVATIALVEVNDPQNYGIATMDGDKIVSMVEKPTEPPSNFASSGLYLFNQEVFDYAPDQKFIMIEKDLSPILAERGKLCGFKFKGRWYDCGTLERWEKAMKEW